MVVMMADVNGDGRDDLAWHDPGGAIHTLLSNGSRFVGAGTTTGYGRPDWAGMGDVNGDGRDDYIHAASSGIHTLFSNGTTFGGASLTTGYGGPLWAGSGGFPETNGFGWPLPPPEARPDGRIKRGASGTYVGNNIYNATGANQTSTGSAVRGGTVTYFVSVQNDARFSDSIRLQGTSGNSAFSVKYFLGTTDITSQVTTGTFRTGALPSGAARLIKIVVKVKPAAAAGANLSASMTSRSEANSGRLDTVKFITRRA